MDHFIISKKGPPSFFGKRRRLIKWLALAPVAVVQPALAVDLLKLLEPKKDSTGKEGPSDLEKVLQILQGAGDIIGSSMELDYESEMVIGKSVALEGFKRYGLPVKDDALQDYVNLVGQAVARNFKPPGRNYYFVVLKSEVFNAVSCPGGIIFITATLMKHLEDESQLAGILAHEVAHVNLKHALQSIQRAKFFEGIGKITVATAKVEKKEQYKNMINDLQTVLFDKGLDQTMEYEADRYGMEIAYRTGYQPLGFIKVLEMLRRNEAGAVKKGSWFSTHPPLSQRIQRCREKIQEYPDAASLATVAPRFLEYRKRL